MDQIFSAARVKMVEEQIASRGIVSEAVLGAMRSVPRHLFVPENLQSSAYIDSPLPIGCGQTISQPYIVAYMTERLAPSPGMKILEVGTGSGYQAAILAFLGCEVYTLERVGELAAAAAEVLALQGWSNVRVMHGDGFSGWRGEAPFDAILVAAAPKEVPAELVEQLAEGGRMILPVGGQDSVQYLMLLTKTGDSITQELLLPVRFVPMLGGTLALQRQAAPDEKWTAP